VEEGIVPGGGCALLYASQTLGALAAAQVRHARTHGARVGAGA
jgi:hypothetical protein